MKEEIRMSIVLTEVVVPDTPQKIEAYKLLCKTLPKVRSRITLAAMCAQIVSYAKHMGVKPQLKDLRGMRDYYEQVSQLVNDTAGVELFFRYLARPGLNQKINNLILDLGSALLKKKADADIGATVLNMDMALTNIAGIHLLAGRGVSMYLPDRTVHIHPLE